ncbi:hypothetical protein D3C87_2123560 [compost metagenome]
MSRLALKVSAWRVSATRKEGEQITDAQSSRERRNRPGANRLGQLSFDVLRFVFEVANHVFALHICAFVGFLGSALRIADGL